VLAAANNDDLQVQKMKEVLTDPQDEGIIQLLIYLLLCRHILNVVSCLTLASVICNWLPKSENKTQCGKYQLHDSISKLPVCDCFCVKLDGLQWLWGCIAVSTRRVMMHYNVG